MKNIRRLLAVAATLVVVPGLAQAQDTARPASAQVLGTWVFEQDLMFQNANGEMDRRKGEATLTLEQRGDSVFGVWQITANGRDVKPMELRGTISGNTVRLRTGARPARLEGPNGTVEIETFQEYVLTANGNDISGQIHTTSNDGGVEIPARDIAGKRRT